MILEKGSVISLTILSLGLALLMSFKPSIRTPDGEDLAKQYCSSCHLFPEPKLLDKKTWKEAVLPNMGWRLCITREGKHPLEDTNDGEAALVRLLESGTASH